METVRAAWSRSGTRSRVKIYEQFSNIFNYNLTRPTNTFGAAVRGFTIAKYESSVISISYSKKTIYIP